MKEMLRGWEKQHPGRVETIFSALQNIIPSQLVDRKLFDFMGLEDLRHKNTPMSDEISAGLDILSL